VVIPMVVAGVVILTVVAGVTHMLVIRLWFNRQRPQHPLQNKPDL
jgi:hypothetical protein